MKKSPARRSLDSPVPSNGKKAGAAGLPGRRRPAGSRYIRQTIATDLGMVERTSIVKQSGDSGLAAALAVFTVRQLAQVCEITPAAIYKWKDLPLRYVMAIEAASKGQLKREKLAPALFKRARR